MNFEKIFNPKTIAFIGATDRRNSVGLGICKNLLEGEKKRKIFFVNPYHKKVLNKKTHPFIGSIEKEIDLAIIAVPAQVVLKVVKECCKKQVGGIIIISAGFAETGKKGENLQNEIKKLTKKAKVPLIGPNCLGLIRPFLRLNASFAPATPKKGEIGFISQSGALIDSVIDRSFVENYGFSALISYGNEADLEISDFMLWLKNDKNTKVIGIYLEAVKNGKRFRKALEEAVKEKPVVILKAGKTKAGSKAALSHTAALTGEYQVYSTLFKQTGAIETDSVEEFFDVLKVLAWQPKINNGIAILTNGGGCGVLAADYCQRLGIKLPELDSKTKKDLAALKIMPFFFSKRNPLDIAGDALSDRYKVSAKALLAQKNIYGLIVIQTLQVMTETEKNARAIIEIKKHWPQKAITCVFMGGKYVLPGIKLLEKNNIPNYQDPKRAATAMKALIKS